MSMYLILKKLIFKWKNCQPLNSTVVGGARINLSEDARDGLSNLLEIF